MTAGTEPDVRCANCGADGAQAFCARCGQETHDLHRSLSGIVGELLDVFAGWDGKIPVSFWLLVRHPGRLTTEFLAGRRVRYLRPLRLYLTMSVAFFLSQSLVHNPRSRNLAFETTRGAKGGGTRVFIPSAAPPPSPAEQAKADATFGAFVSRTAGETGPGLTPWVKHRFKEGLRAVQRLPPEQRTPALQQAFFSKMGNAIFLLLPVFAALVRLLYRRTPTYYAEHVVFALHIHAFAMFAFMLGHLVSSAFPDPWSTIAAIPLLSVPLYLFVALRRVYGGTRSRTALKLVALSASYGSILFAVMGLTAVIAIMNFGT